jgi:hypothetical protein
MKSQCYKSQNPKLFGKLRNWYLEFVSNFGFQILDLALSGGEAENYGLKTVAIIRFLCRKRSL